MKTDEHQNPREDCLNTAGTTSGRTEEDITPEELARGHTQYGNNFYLLFAARLERERDPATTTPIQIVYLERMEERYGEQWGRFLGNNADLINEIYDCIDGLTPYNRLLHLYADLLRYPDHVGTSGGEPDLEGVLENMGDVIETIGIKAWRRLNHFLEIAAEKMRLEGINPEEFFG